MKKRKVQELELHTFWKFLSYNKVIFTQNDEKVTIENLGKYNRSWGPDFLNAHLQFGNENRYGDIEIHVNEKDWVDHKHDQDERYNKVILHVFLNENQVYPALNHFKQVLPAWKIPLNLWNQFKEYAGDKPHQNYILGVCGLMLQEKLHQSRLQRFIIQAAQLRLEKKADEYKIWMKEKIPYNQILYQGMMRSMGYTSFAQPFFNLAKVYPYHFVLKQFKTISLKASFTDIVGKWLTCLQLLPIAKKQFPSWIQIFIDMENKKFQMPIEQSFFVPAKVPTLPQSNPILRLILFYFHLYNTTDKQLFHTWYILLKELQNKFLEFNIIRDSRKETHNLDEEIDYPHPQDCKKIINTAIRQFMNLFAVPTSYQSIFTSQKPLISRGRFIILLVNVILPIFYNWSKEMDDRLLEKTLYQLFIQMPPEDMNYKTVFIENRLGLSHKHKKIKNELTLIKNMSYYQGLIHIYDECCQTFDIGCQSCLFSDLLNINA